ncbi:MAG TPA: 2-phospho-L-lactate transferase CofD family protein, partial [Nitrososphaeraceae archaeon]|nr:2-phospho-L-lactate transferase CofD family protein [Nitrososphaeraceae archaeon]
LKILRSSDVIVLAPGNPITSIGPIISIAQIREELIKQRGNVIAISPVIGKKAISGPAVKYLRAKGIRTTCVDIAKYYSELISNIVIDFVDRHFSNRIKKMGISSFETNIMMNNLQEEKRLAKFILKVMNY